MTVVPQFSCDVMPCTECGIVKLHVCIVGSFSLCDVQYHVFLNNFNVLLSLQNIIIGGKKKKEIDLKLG